MSSTLPTRLFKLDTEAIRRANDSIDLATTPLGQIVQGQDLSKLDSCTYCAISHVWGKDPPMFDVANIPWQVPIVSKEKLIFVLKACERRGYGYMWIDLLCIDQRKNTGDSKKEVTKMRQYYKNAHATIVFGFNWRDFASHWAKVEASIREWGQDQDKIIDPDWDAFGHIDTFVKDDWFWRVWTLEEAVVSTTTTASGTVKHPALYNSTRLLTSDGTPINLPCFCELINWTYIALGKLPYKSATGKYSWIHPGAGVVNDNGWWMMAVLNDAIRLGTTPLHPVQAIRLTRYRDTTRSIDRLKGIYALIDSSWHNFEGTEDAALEDTAKKYIDKKEGALLMAMGVIDQPKMTWAAAIFPKSETGSVVPNAGEYPLIAAKIESDGLHLTTAGICKVTVKRKAYGDGSGELVKLIDDLFTLQSTYDISSVVALLKLAIRDSQIKSTHAAPPDSLYDIYSSIDNISDANAVSSALRGAFSGWCRYIIRNKKLKTAYLAWLPLPVLATSNYSLLWARSGLNDWAVIVEGDVKKGCKKVGIAFVHSAPVGSQTNVIIV